ncbi:PhnD/SsuA/transferrin family substrate-binding protein [Candidatus Uabimicrobium amorphum]|uniref:Phosphate ABC transporter substrate-binding protein n=1 Tax=Uabimicrobium amorphum TaxID=2596890 RepID=A0A5S9IN83_UABAM|nr:PhnD/SsuA/transferrin family substrate-binding protein [Candidatus Uabimicrobium amorphum]BBM84170.1 phosphate ABC transporter substrate-binding protein [Candidatus Uabimicrobium amorphum]
MNIASLPWYDFPEIKPATDSFWHFFASRLKKAGFHPPDFLTRNISYKHQWQSPFLLFSQACGYDVVKPFIRDLRVVATPCYNVPDCLDHNYSSFIIVRSDAKIESIEDLYHKSCAINCQHSHSGANILYFVVANYVKNCTNFFSRAEYSGSHENSIRMVSENKVDTAAIDCLSYHILKKFRPQLFKKIRIIHRTPHAPAPPYVTSASRSELEITTIREILWELNEAPQMQPIFRELFIREIKYIPFEEYFHILDMEKIALKKYIQTGENN